MVLTVILYAYILVPYLPGYCEKIRVTALLSQNPNAKNNEIYLTNVYLEGVSTKFYPTNGRWYWQNGMYVFREAGDERNPYTPDTSFTMMMLAGRNRSIEFFTNSYKGIVQVQYKDQEFVVDCYSESDGKVSVNLPDSDSVLLAVNDLIKAIELITVVVLACFLLFGKENGLKQDNRATWADLLKILSAFMIVVIHSSGYVYNKAYGAEGSKWLLTLLLNAVPRFAVPCFLFITGMLTLGNQCEIKKYFRKALRLVIVTLIWSVAYALYLHREDIEGIINTVV